MSWVIIEVRTLFAVLFRYRNYNKGFFCNFLESFKNIVKIFFGYMLHRILHKYEVKFFFEANASILFKSVNAASLFRNSFAALTAYSEMSQPTAEIPSSWNPFR